MVRKLNQIKPTQVAKILERVSIFEQRLNMASKEIYNPANCPLNRYYIHPQDLPFGWEVYVDLNSRQFVIERIITGAAIRMYSIDNRYNCGLTGGKSALNTVYDFLEEDGSWFLITKRVYAQRISVDPNEKDVKILILNPFYARVVKHLLKKGKTL